MTLPITAVQRLVLTGAGEPLPGAFTKIDQNTANAFSDLVSLDARLAAVEARSTPIGYQQPAANPFVYGAAAAAWSAAAVKATGTSASFASSGTAYSSGTRNANTPLDLIDLGTIGGVHYFVSIIFSSGGSNLYAQAIALNGTTMTLGPVIQLISTYVNSNRSNYYGYENVSTASTPIALLKVTSSNSSVTQLSVNTTSLAITATVTNYTTSATAFGSLSGIYPSSGNNRQGYPVGVSSTFHLADVAGGGAAAIAMLRAQQATIPDILMKHLTGWTYAGAAQQAPTISFDSLGGGYFLAATLTKAIGQAPTLGFMLLYADDYGAKLVAAASINSPTISAVSVYALSPTAAVVYWNNGSQRVATEVNVSLANGVYSLGIGLQSPYYVGGTGVQLPLIGTLNYDALDQYMVTKETAANTVGLRRLTLDPNGQTLTENGAAVTFPFGAAVDTSANFVLGPAVRVGTDMLLVSGCSDYYADTGVTTPGVATYALVQLS